MVLDLSNLEVKNKREVLTMKKIKRNIKENLLSVVIDKVSNYHSILVINDVCELVLKNSSLESGDFINLNGYIQLEDNTLVSEFKYWYELMINRENGRTMEIFNKANIEADFDFLTRDDLIEELEEEFKKVGGDVRNFIIEEILKIYR